MARNKKPKELVLVHENPTTKELTTTKLSLQSYMDSKKLDLPEVDLTYYNFVREKYYELIVSTIAHLPNISSVIGDLIERVAVTSNNLKQLDSYFLTKGVNAKDDVLWKRRKDEQMEHTKNVKYILDAVFALSTGQIKTSNKLKDLAEEITEAEKHLAKPKTTPDYQ